MIEELSTSKRKAKHAEDLLCQLKHGVDGFRELRTNASDNAEAVDPDVLVAMPVLKSSLEALPNFLIALPSRHCAVYTITKILVGHLVVLPLIKGENGVFGIVSG